MSAELITIGLQAIRAIVDRWSSTTSTSLIDYTRAARVEPIVLIDTDLIYQEVTSEVQQSLLSQFAGYYLQAVALSTPVGKINVMKTLDHLQPHRNPIDSAINEISGAKWLMATESYNHALPMPKNKLAMEAIAMEISNDELQEARLKLDKEKLELEKKKYEDNRNDINHRNAIDADKRNTDAAASGAAIGRDSAKELKELAGLSVGKIFSVDITDGTAKATIPISIRLMASSLPSQSLVHILSIGGKDNSMKERWHGYLAGRLRFWQDLCFCQDLITEHRKELMHDKDGMRGNLLKAQRKNQLSAIISKTPSVATASNLIVISSNTIAALEREIMGDMSNFRVREKIFADTYIMIMAVVSMDWQRVTFYSRGNNFPTEVSFRDLRSSNKGSGPDITEILKAYQQGASLSL